MGITKKFWEKIIYGGFYIISRMTSKTLPTIKEFRQKVIEVMVTKGVEPPLPDSPEEQELYKGWLEGWKKLNQWKG